MIAYGVGSNGKSLCAAMLEALLEKGKYYVAMSKDCLVKGGRSEAKNAPKPYLLALKDRRFVVCEELGDDAVLDEAIVKAATGQSMIPDACNLHGNPVSFFPTHLAVVVTNIKPKVNVDDDAMRRRILFLLFERKFVTQANLDKNNKMHRLMDKKLGDNLLSNECLTQFLTWLAVGAKRWYEEGLGEPPAAMKAAFNQYMEENDDVANYIDMHCNVGDDR